MTTLALRQKSTQSVLRAISLPQINLKFLYFFGISALVLMLVFYIFLINNLTSGSYVIKNYNKQISALQQENNSLEAQSSASGFMGNAQQQAKVLGFEKTTQVKYIEVGVGNSLAQAR